MIACDRYPTERATTFVILASGKHLTLRDHHTREVAQKMTQRGETFDIEYMN